MNSKKNLERAIQKEKDKLIKRAQKKGLYENFGQKEVIKLKEKFIDTSNFDPYMMEMGRMIDQFEDWASNLDLSDIKV